MGPTNIRPISHQSHVMQRCPLTTVTEIRVPDTSMSSLPGDSSYYRFPCPPESGDPEVSPRWHPQKSGPAWVNALSWETLELLSTAEGEYDAVTRRTLSLECSSRLLRVCVKLDACPSGLNMFTATYDVPYSCPRNRIICTIFLDSTYIC